MPSTRRDALRLAGAGAAAAIAGCSGGSGGDSPFAATAGDGSAPSPARNWLYDPTDYEDQSAMTVTFQSPARLTAASDHLADELGREVAGLRFDATLPPTETDWTVRAASPLFEGPSLFACGGDFDEAAAAENANVMAGTDREPTGEETVDDFTVRHYGDTAHGAFGDGVVVSASATAAADFDALLRTDETLVDSVEDADPFVTRLGFDEATTCRLARDSETDEWTGRGVSYDVAGADTRVTFAELSKDRGAGDLREIGAAVDGLTDVSADGRGDLAWIEGTAPTDRLAFGGQLFTLMELPYEEG